MCLHQVSRSPPSCSGGGGPAVCPWCTRYCTVLYCILLYRTVLYCTVLHQAVSWQHGVFLGASVKSEATAAAEHKGKVTSYFILLSHADKYSASPLRVLQSSTLL